MSYQKRNFQTTLLDGEIQLIPPTVHLGLAADRSNMCVELTGDPITFSILFLYFFFLNKVSSICQTNRHTVESMPKDFGIYRKKGVKILDVVSN